MPAKARTRGVSTHPLRIVCRQKKFAYGSQMQGCPAPDGPDNLHAGALTVGALNVHNFITLTNAQIDRLLDQLVQLTHGHQRCIPYVESVFDQVS